jgi:hypothetical protein
MRRSLAVAAILASALLFAGCRTTTDARPDRLHVLFVGNSLTYYNDLPAMVASIHRRDLPRQDLQTALLATGGGSLRERLDDGGLADALQQDHFDVVVLQDLGGWPLCADEDHRCMDSEQALQESAALVRRHHARPVWYATWQRLPMAQNALSLRVEAVSERLDIEAVNVGRTMQTVDDPVVLDRLLLPDGHPTALGSWLVAGALYVAIERAPLPRMTPGRSCGVDWQGRNLGAQSLASHQSHDSPSCHPISAADWQAIRKAILATQR